MKIILPLGLILGAVVIAATVWLGSQNTKTASDAELIQEAILEQRAQEQQRLEAAARLMTKVLPAPASCEGLTTQFVYDICATEPDDLVSWPDWTQIAGPAQQACILDAFHQTNAHAFEIRGEVYDPAAPDNTRVTRFISDLCSASLWTDGIDYGDADKAVSDLVAGYYADRADSRVKPGQSY